MANVIALAGTVAVCLAATSGCGNGAEETATQVAGGDPERGKSTIRAYGCGACHTIPGVLGANATVGPPLTAVARQAYVAGVLPNVPEKLVRWIQSPVAVDPRTAMPDLGMTEEEARDIAAYLYTLED